MKKRFTLLLFILSGIFCSAQLSSILNSQRIGTAANLLTVSEGACNLLDVDNTLNTVIFININDITRAPGTDICQYHYDISRNRGHAWTINVGPITNSALLSTGNVNGRYPQAVIYNPAANTITDS